MDDQIGLVAMSVLALCVVGLITFQIWSHKTGRITPKGGGRMKPRVALGCVVVWIIVATPLINMFLPEDFDILQDRPMLIAFLVLFPAIAFLGFWYRSYYDYESTGYSGD